MKTISDAKRLIAANSLEGMRLLGAGVSRPCSQARYNNAAAVALADPEVGFSKPERKLIASFIQDESDDSRDSALPRIRVTAEERERLDDAAQKANLTLSAYIRQRLDLD